MILQLDNLGSGGVVTDIPPHELPLNAFSSVMNVRLRDEAVERSLGYDDVFTAPSTPPYWLLPWQAPTTYYWFYFGAGASAKIYRTTGGASTDVSRVGDYTPGTYARWNGGVLAGVPVCNHSNLGNNYPQEWDGTADFQDMVTWPMGAGGDGTWYCRVLRVFKNFCIALDMQEDGTRYPVRLRWNSPVDPGVAPGEWNPLDTNLAGSKTFADTTAPLVDCLPLRDVNVVYKEDSVHLMQYVGGAFVFNFRQAFSEFGLLSQRCVKSFFGKHFVVSFNDVVLHDGQSAQSLVTNARRRAIFNTLSSDNYENSFVVAYPQRTEMWLCVPINGSGVVSPTLAHIWNWTTNKWTTRDLPGMAHIGLGIIDESSTSVTFNDLLAGTASGTFDQRLGAFDQRTYNPTVLLLLGCDTVGTLFQKMDDTNQNDGSDFASYVERTGLALNGMRGGELTVDPHTIKFVRRLYPKITADPGVTVTIKIGGQDHPGGTVNWTSYTFDPNSDTYISCRTQGKLLAYYVGSTSGGQWKLHSMGFDLDVVGTQ